jgi:iron complex outermembrane recepter protein
MNPMPFPLLLKPNRLAVAVAICSSLVAATGSTGSWAQAPKGDELRQLEEVITTGTRVKGRTATETAVPIDVFSVEDIARTGSTETGVILQKLSPSFNFSRTTISDGTDIIRPATLRGLNPDQVLVLVNGKRRHSQAWNNIQQTVGRGSSGTDINAIPASAIQQVEVLRDGAAAQYGSDAIAGVINIILDTDVETSNISVRYGEYDEGDGESTTVSGNTGFEIGDGGYITFSGEYRDRQKTNRAVPTGRTDLFEPGTTIMRIGDSEAEDSAIFVNASLPTSVGEFYGFGGWSKREGESGGFYRFAERAQRAVPQVYPNGFLPLQTTEVEDYSFSGGFRKDLGGDWQMDASVTYGQNEFSFGTKNSINVSLAAEAFYAAGGDPATDIAYIDNEANNVINPIIPDPAGQPDTPANRAAAAASPTSADSGSIEFDQTTFNLDFSGSVEIGLPQSLYVATGLEYRDENYQINEGDLVSYSCGSSPDITVRVPSITDPTAFAACGMQAFPGYGPISLVDENRDSKAAYIDLETNLTDNILVGVAVRYEDYSDAGDQATGKFSGRWQIVDNFAVRGAVSTGFRAPALSQRFFSTIFTDIDGPNLVQTFHAPEGSLVPSLFGVNDLQHEESNQYSLGLIWDPTNNLSVTLDAYQINIDDRIVLGGKVGGGFTEPDPVLDDFLQQFGFDNAQFFSNAIDTETKGVELVVTHNAQLGKYGYLTTTLSGAYNETSVENINAPAGISEDVFFSQAQIDNVETGQPQERFIADFDWRLDQFSANLRFNYYGDVETSFFSCEGLGLAADCEPLGIAGPQNSVKSDGKLLTDLEFSYDFGNGLVAAIGGENIFDEYPDKLPKVSSHGFISNGPALKPGASTLSGLQAVGGNFQYPWESTPFGTGGAFWYGRLSYTF